MKSEETDGEEKVGDSDSFGFKAVDVETSVNLGGGLNAAVKVAGQAHAPGPAGPKPSASPALTRC